MQLLALAAADRQFASCSRELRLGAAKSTMISPIDRGSALDRTRSIESGFLREHPAQRSTRSNVARLAAAILAAIIAAIVAAILAAILSAIIIIVDFLVASVINTFTGSKKKLFPMP